MKRNIYILILICFISTSVFAVENTAQIKSETLVKTSSSWDGTPLPKYSDQEPEISILKIEIAPGAILPVHEHPVINAGYMISGELTVKTEEGKTLHLKAGDTIIEVVNKWHYGKNETDKPTVILVFYAGVKDSAITILKK